MCLAFKFSRTEGRPGLVHFPGADPPSLRLFCGECHTQHLVPAGFVRQVPKSCASAPTSCCFHLHPGERGEVTGAGLMLQDVPVRYPCWRLEHETRDQGWRQPAGCGDCESPAKERAHGTQPVVPSPWHPTVVPSLSAAFEAFWKWHGAGAGGPGQLSLASPCPVRCTMEQRG